MAAVPEAIIFLHRAARSERVIHFPVAPFVYLCMPVRKRESGFLTVLVPGNMITEILARVVSRGVVTGMRSKSRLANAERMNLPIKKDIRRAGNIARSLEKT